MAVHSFNRFNMNGLVITAAPQTVQESREGGVFRPPFSRSGTRCNDSALLEENVRQWWLPGSCSYRGRREVNAITGLKVETGVGEAFGHTLLGDAEWFKPEPWSSTSLARSAVLTHCIESLWPKLCLTMPSTLSRGTRQSVNTVSASMKKS